MARTLDLAAHTVRREAFVDAAQRLMQAKGYEEMSIQDLPDDLDVSRGAFYHYFESKQALLEAVVERMADVVLASLAPVTEDPTLSAGAKLEQLFGGIGQWKTDRRALVMSLLRVWVSDHNAIFREKVRRRLVSRLVPLFTRIVEQGVGDGAFTTGSPAETAMVLVMLILGFQDRALELFLARQENTIGYDDVERIFASYNQAFERVLGAPAGTLNLIDRKTLSAWFG